MREKAIGYLRRAGQRAQATFANTEALGFYRSALQQIDVLGTSAPNERLAPSAAPIHESVGDIDSLIGQHESARVAYEKALQRVVEHDAVWSSRLRRKMANTWVIQRQYKNAEQSLDEAEMILQNRRSSTEEWQQEWLQIQLDRMWLHYWRGDQEITTLAERMRPQVEQYATVLQRGKFFHGLVLAALRRDRYTADEETIANAQISLTAVEKSKVVPEIGHARFILGFSYLWAGKFEPAEKWICEALTLAKQTGDIVLESRCFTYLTVIQRRRGEIEPARYYAEQSLASASAARMLEYIGVAKGNLAWVDLRSGDVSRAYEHGCEAVGQLRQTPLGDIILWIALWPLIGVAIARDQTAEAIQHAEKLLVPTQMALPPHLRMQMRAAIDAWKENNHSKSNIHLKMAADLAVELGYL
jgi:eukaryotic-like serine/threonine-protein kinase